MTRLTPTLDPMMPAPWVSGDAGETWVWGDYFMTFQKNPPSVEPGAGCRVFHYAMAVFPRAVPGPPGRSPEPIATVALEQFPLSVLGALLGEEGVDEFLSVGGKDTSDSMLCLWDGGLHSNYGPLDPASGPDAVRRRFFDILRGRLALSGEPRLLGTLREAFGHPETGLPRPGRGGGCPFSPLEPVDHVAKLAAMPAPWTGSGDGEAWGWGDFFMSFQTDPPSSLDLFLQSEGQGGDGPGGRLAFLFAMTVFWRLDRNPYGPSAYPIMSVALGREGSGSGRSGPAGLRPTREAEPGDVLLYLFDS
jgi:hypothetical protein